MWQRFTERARKVVYYAQEEAGRVNENSVGSAHMLLAILRDPDSVASKTMAAMNVDFDRLRSDVEKGMPEGSGLDGDMKLTAEAKQVVDAAHEEAKRHGVSYIGTEHLLLGILRDSLGLGTIALGKQGVTLQSAQAEAYLHGAATSAHLTAPRSDPKTDVPAPEGTPNPAADTEDHS